MIHFNCLSHVRQAQRVDRLQELYDTPDRLRYRRERKHERWLRLGDANLGREQLDDLAAESGYGDPAAAAAWSAAHEPEVEAEGGDRILEVEAGLNERVDAAGCAQCVFFAATVALASVCCTILGPVFLVFGIVCLSTSHPAACGSGGRVGGGATLVTLGSIGAATLAMYWCASALCSIAPLRRVVQIYRSWRARREMLRASPRAQRPLASAAPASPTRGAKDVAPQQWTCARCFYVRNHGEPPCVMCGHAVALVNRAAGEGGDGVDGESGGGGARRLSLRQLNCGVGRWERTVVATMIDGEYELRGRVQWREHRALARLRPRTLGDDGVLALPALPHEVLPQAHAWLCVFDEALSTVAWRPAADEYTLRVRGDGEGEDEEAAADSEEQQRRSLLEENHSAALDSRWLQRELEEHIFSMALAASLREDEAASSAEGESASAVRAGVLAAVDADAAADADAAPSESTDAAAPLSGDAADEASAESAAGEEGDAAAVEDVRRSARAATLAAERSSRAALKRLRSSVARATSDASRRRATRDAKGSRARDVRRQREAREAAERVSRMPFGMKRRWFTSTLHSRGTAVAEQRVRSGHDVYALGLGTQFDPFSPRRGSERGRDSGESSGGAKAAPVVRVRRDDILRDSFDSVMAMAPTDLRRRFMVRFEGEAGSDAGGIFREWLQLLTSALFGAEHGLWESAEEAGRIVYHIAPAPLRGLRVNVHAAVAAAAEGQQQEKRSVATVTVEAHASASASTCGAAASSAEKAAPVDLARVAKGASSTSAAGAGAGRKRAPRTVGGGGDVSTMDTGMSEWGESSAMTERTEFGTGWGESSVGAFTEFSERTVDEATEDPSYHTARDRRSPTCEPKRSGSLPTLAALPPPPPLAASSASASSAAPAVAPAAANETGEDGLRSAIAEPTASNATPRHDTVRAGPLRGESRRKCFRFAGRVLGKVLLEGENTFARLARPLLKQITGRPLVCDPCYTDELEARWGKALSAAREGGLRAGGGSAGGSAGASKSEANGVDVPGRARALELPTRAFERVDFNDVAASDSGIGRVLASMTTLDEDGFEDLCLTFTAMERDSAGALREVELRVDGAGIEVGPENWNACVFVCDLGPSARSCLRSCLRSFLTLVPLSRSPPPHHHLRRPATATRCSNTCTSIVSRATSRVSSAAFTKSSRAARYLFSSPRSCFVS
jgi:hypothetical protein